MIEESTITERSNAKPFRLSWIDLFSAWIQKRPGNGWAYYTGIAFFLVLVQAIVLRIEGGEFIVSLHPVQIFFSTAIPFLLAVMPYFNHRALSALESIRPALKVTEDQFRDLGFRISNLPGLPSLLIGVLAILYVLFAEYMGGGVYQVDALAGYPLSMNIARASYLICWWCFATFCFHTIHQLNLINLIYTRHTRIDLFQMRPLYEFSNLTAIKSGSLIVLPIGFLFLNRATVRLSDPIVFGFYLVISLIAFLTFLIPQLGIHRLQNEEQGRLLDEINHRSRSIMLKIHTYVDAEKYDQAVNLRSVLGTLEDEKNAIKKISTWPWQPETLRWLFTALVLPLLMWIAQYYLGRWLN